MLEAIQDERDVMRKVVLALLLQIGLLSSGNCVAERLFPATFIGQPVMHLKDGSVQACGVRFMGFDAPLNASNSKESVWVSDASFMLDRGGYGLVKAILKKATVGDVLNKRTPVLQAFNSFWIKAPGAASTQPVNGKVGDGENKGSKIYVTDIVSVMALHEAILDHKSIQLGIKSKDSNDFALYGEVKLSEKEFEQVGSCMDELIGLMQKDLEKSGKK
jgi:hypothetical protein